MNSKEEWGEVLKGVDAALRRAALRAKEEAKKNGTPYVVLENTSNNKLPKIKKESKE